MSQSVQLQQHPMYAVCHRYAAHNRRRAALAFMVFIDLSEGETGARDICGGSRGPI